MSIIPPVNMSASEEAKILEELLAGHPSSDDKNGDEPVGFSVVEKPDLYVIGGLSKLYTQGTFSLQLSKELLDDGKSHTQQEWQDNAGLRTKNGTVWEIPSGPEYTGLVLGLHDHKDKPEFQQKVEAVKSLLKVDFDNYWMMTSTHIVYRAGQQQTLVGRLVNRSQASVKDTVIHHYKQIEHKLDESIVGANGWLDQSMSESLYALTGCKDVGSYVSSFEWVTGKKSYLWRVNTTHSQDAERALVLGVYNVNDRFNVNADDNFNRSRPARGVTVARKKNHD